jgi:hypothetical protein
MLEKFSGKKTPLWPAPMRSKNQKVLSAEEAKTMPSTSVTKDKQCLENENPAFQQFLELRKFYAITSRKTKDRSD